MSAHRAIPHRGLVTLACMLAQFMAAVEGTIVAAATPTIAGDLGGFELFPWVFGAYMLAQTAATPIYGKLADVYGRKRVFFVGCTIFLLSSLACGLAWGMVPLIVFRFAQGLGAGAIQPIAWTIMGDIYTPTERARMQGWLSAVWSSSAVGGPVLGAFIVQHMHWSLIFWINLPVGVLTLFVLAAFLKETVERRRHRVDWIGAMCLTVGVGAWMAALVQGPSLTSSGLWTLIGIGAAFLALLAWHESRTPEPIVPFLLWKRRVLALGNAATFLVGGIIIVNSVYVPSFIQVAMGRSPTISGLAIGCSSVFWTTGTMVAGRLMVRTSYRFTSVLGGTVALAGTLGLTLIGPGSGVGWVMAGAGVCGFGMGFCNTTFMVSVQTAVDWSQRGAVTAANMFLRTLGQAVGAGVFGAIFNAWLNGEGPHAAEQVNRMLEIGGREAMDAGLVARLGGAIGHAMHDVWLTAAAMTLVILGLAWALPASLNPVRQTVHGAAPEPSE